MKPYEQKYIKEVSQRIDKGGVVWCIERTDTNKFLRLTIGFLDGGAGHSRNESHVNWDDVIGAFPATHVFLTKEDAEKHMPELTEGGCRHCGHGSTPIPTIVTEHEFVPSKES